jgi:hypothetical protein
MVAPGVKEINARDAIEQSRSHAIKARSPHRCTVVDYLTRKKVKGSDTRAWHIVRPRRTPQGVGSFETVACRAVGNGSRQVVEVVDLLGNIGRMSVRQARAWLTYERTEDGRRMVVADAQVRALIRDERERVARLALLGTVWGEDVPGYEAYNREAHLVRQRAGLPALDAPTHKPRFVAKSTASELERLKAELAVIEARREERENEG